MTIDGVVARVSAEAKDFLDADAAGTVAAAARSWGVPSPWVGLLTSGRGARCPFGGPVTDVGWAAAVAARRALEAGVRRWLAEHA